MPNIRRKINKKHKSITQLINQLEETGKLTSSTRTLQRKFTNFISAEASTLEEKELVKENFKDENGHYTIDSDMEPLFLAILDGLDRSLQYYEKKLQSRSSEIVIDDLKEAFEAGISIIESWASEDQIQEFIDLFDELYQFSEFILVEKIQETFRSMLQNANSLNYPQTVRVTKSIFLTLQEEILPQVIQDVLLTNLLDPNDNSENEVPHLDSKQDSSHFQKHGEIISIENQFYYYNTLTNSLIKIDQEMLLQLLENPL